MTTQISLHSTTRATGRDASNEKGESIAAWRAGAHAPAHRASRDRSASATSPAGSSLATVSTRATPDEAPVVILDPSISSSTANPASQYDDAAREASTSASDASLVAAPLLAADSALDSFAQYVGHLSSSSGGLNLDLGSALRGQTPASLSGEWSTLSGLEAALVTAAGHSASTTDLSFVTSATLANFAADGDGLFASFANRAAGFSDQIAGATQIVDGGGLISVMNFGALSTTAYVDASNSAMASAFQRFETALTIDFSASSDGGDALGALRAGGRVPVPAAAHQPATPPFSAAPAVTTLPTVTLTVAADKQTVVILDTGISSTISNLIYQYDFVGNDSNASTTVTHGSIVVSQVLAADSQANIIVLKVADDAGNISTSAVDSALDWVAKYASQLNIASVNLSFGDSSVVSAETVTSLSDEFATLSRVDVAVVVAAGNSASKTGVSALASDANVISVSASNSDLLFSSYSNRDADLTDLVADGTNIVYGASTVSGTSFSAPLVAGAIADLKGEFYTTYGRELTVKEALLLLQATGDAMNTTSEVSGTSSTAGDGYVQLDLASSLAAVHDLSELTLIGIVV